MSLKATNLYVQMGQLPATFTGTPNELAAAMVARMKIVSPNGTNFIYIGDTEPTSNVGPWLKNGTKWYVWDVSTKRYVPVDISDSASLPFFMGATTPTSSEPPLWLRTTLDATSTSPFSFGDPIGWYVFNGTNWIPYVGITLSGPTASRPASPVGYQQYYDTDISCLIWWERAAWRTVSGNIGDVKAVAFDSLTDALTANPGWEVLGAGNVALRGRIIMQAAKDAGSSPVTTLSVGSGLTVRAAFETFGEAQLLSTGSPIVFPPQLALWHLVKV
jgi:hypothetical protein